MVFSLSAVRAGFVRGENISSIVSGFVPAGGKAEAGDGKGFRKKRGVSIAVNLCAGRESRFGRAWMSRRPVSAFFPGRGYRFREGRRPVGEEKCCAEKTGERLPVYPLISIKRPGLYSQNCHILNQIKY